MAAPDLSVFAPALTLPRSTVRIDRKHARAYYAALSASHLRSGEAMHSFEDTRDLVSSSDGSGVDRRAFLRLAGAATLGLSLLLEACRNPSDAGVADQTTTLSNPTPVAPATTPGSTSVPSATRVQFPTYVPIQG